MFSAMVNDGYCFALGGVNWRTGSVPLWDRHAWRSRDDDRGYLIGHPILRSYIVYISLFSFWILYFFGHIYLVNWAPSL